MNENISKYTETLPEVGRLILQFARTNRATYHEDGMRPESDTDHTVMLSVCACALAEELYKDSLNLGKVAQFSIVHDLVEVYADDTDTFGISEQGQKDKEKREHEALQKIKYQFDAVFPWISRTIEEYESLESKEARFVKTVDKCMSKVTHILNGGQYFKNKNTDGDNMRRDYRAMVKKATDRYAYDFPEVITIMESLIEKAAEKTYE